MGYPAETEKAFHHSQASILSEEVLSPRGSRNMKLQDKSKGLKSQRPLEQRSRDRRPARSKTDDIRSVLPPKPSRNYPSRKAEGIDELVKNMSSVPSYLQCLERGENVQEKALNVGVLDWRRLERWTYKQKCTSSFRTGSSPSTSNASSSFSTFSSSKKSSGSISSPLSRKKQSHGLDSQSDSLADGGKARMMGLKNSIPTMVSLDSQTSATSLGAQHGCLDADCNPSGDSLFKKHGKCKKKAASVNFITSSHPSRFGSSPITSKTDEILSFDYDKVRAKHTKLEEADKGKSYEENCFSGLHLAGDSLQDQHMSEGMSEHLKQNVVHDSCVICESFIGDKERTLDITRKSFSEDSYLDGMDCNHLPSDVPRSCPLPSINQKDGRDAAINLLYASEVSVTRSQAKLKERKQATSNHHELVDSTVTDADFNKRRATAITGRGLSPSRQSIPGWNWLSRSSSLREGSPVRQMKAADCIDCIDGDKASAAGRGRRSPLRRMLDPFLKPKNRLASGPIPSSPVPHAYEARRANKHLLRKDGMLTNGTCTAMYDNINSSTSQAETNFISSYQVTVDTGRSSVQNDELSKSPRQALLQLAWKNGQPLFMFSSCDSDILAATMTKKDVSEKDSGYGYTIFSVREVEKKSGAWMNQGNKSKKAGLFSNVVAQMKLSCPKVATSESIAHSVKEFVLFGSHLTPTSPGPTDSVFDAELAAIIITDPIEMLKNPSGDMPHNRGYRELSNILTHNKSSNNQVENLQFEANAEALSGIVAILPSGVHGSSTEARPSSLVKRWKMGGVCDCGGWDEGCMLSALTDKLPDGRSTTSVQVCHATDGTHRIELFVQAGARKNRLAFSMVAFKEGLYTVDFRAPVGSLEAFAICISILHGRSSCHSGVSMGTENLQDHGRSPTNAHRESRTRSVPSHPPLSPIGRA